MFHWFTTQCNKNSFAWGQAVLPIDTWAKDFSNGIFHWCMEFFLGPLDQWTFSRDQWTFFKRVQFVLDPNV